MRKLRQNTQTNTTILFANVCSICAWCVVASKSATRMDGVGKRLRRFVCAPLFLVMYACSCAANSHQATKIRIERERESCCWKGDRKSNIFHRVFLCTENTFLPFYLRQNATRHWPRMTLGFNFIFLYGKKMKMEPNRIKCHHKQQSLRHTRVRCTQLFYRSHFTAI